MSDSATPRARLIPSILLILVLLGAGSGIASMLHVMNVEPERRVPDNPPLVVEAMTVAPTDAVERHLGYGTVKALRSVNLSAEVSARVVEIVRRVRAGSAVAEGDAIVRLDDRQYKSALDRAEAMAEADRAGLAEIATEEANLRRMRDTAQQEVDLNMREYKRLADLYETEAASEREVIFASLALQQSRRILQEYESQLARIEPRRAQLTASRSARLSEAEQAQLNIERCTIRAPFDGVLQMLHVEHGDWVAPGTVVAALLDPMRVEIGIALPASVHHRVAVGAESSVVSESTPGVAWRGHVARIAPSVDEQTRTLTVYVEVNNAEQERPLVPGTFVRAEVLGPRHEDSLIIPRSAIRKNRVWIIDDGQARQRQVSVVQTLTERAVVEGELRFGDRVILTQLSRMDDGTPVREAATVGGPETPVTPAVAPRESASP